MDAVVLHCKEGSQFHTGETSLEDTSDIIHSDTLFSAITNIYELAFQAGAEFVSLVKERKILFSSCFYCITTKKENRSIYFLPKPLLRYTTNLDIAQAKKNKKIKYISIGVWQKIQSSFDKSTLSTSFDLLSHPTIGGEFSLLESELPGSIALTSKKFRNVVSYPKTRVHQPERENAFYYETTVQMNPIQLGDDTLTGHYYFLLEHSLSKNEWERFNTCLRILADEGIGGERSTGNGVFTFVDAVHDILIPPINSSQYRLSLSMLSPNSVDEFYNVQRYELITRGGGSLGVNGDPERHRRRVRMIKEGAILSSDIVGNLVDVSPPPPNNPLPHPIYRNGMNCAIPFGVL